MQIQPVGERKHRHLDSISIAKQFIVCAVYQTSPAIVLKVDNPTSMEELEQQKAQCLEAKLKNLP